MKELPSCLLKRYRALDNVIKDLRSVTESGPSFSNCECGCKSDRGLKLMSEFWNMLKDDPNTDQWKMVPQTSYVGKSEINSKSHSTTCYVPRGRKCKKCSETGKSSKTELPLTPTPVSSVTECDPSTPIYSVLCNLEEAASFDQKCSDKFKELMETEEQLKAAIQRLEAREKVSITLLKEADCMWMSMQDTYKKKMVETFDRQKLLEKELRGVEMSTKKWRENMKDLEAKIERLDKHRNDVKDKTVQKSNDIKYLDTEIKDLQNRLENNKKEIEATKKSIVSKKEATDKKIAKYREDIKNLEKVVAGENKTKKEKELQGSKIIKESRDDLQKICGILLKKKLENEDLRAERAALSSEIELLLQARDKCRDKCDLRQVSIENEIRNLDKEINDQKSRCGKCNQGTDSLEITRFCSDCPKCLEERRCALVGDHCGIDHTMDCVCMTVKRKFLDNVFENMYTVLDRKIKKGSGKAVADQILECLKRSRNGKLDNKTRKMLQEFILTSVKQHLNLTIVGGAVKTRCEMDPDMYRQLMTCIQKVQVTQPEKVDKGTESKKAPCSRWGGTSECNCPKGPKNCICTKRGPPATHDPTPCPADDDYEDDKKKTCPYKAKTICGPECGKEDEKFKHMMNEISKARSDTCGGSSCKMSKNKKTLPCVLEPELSSTIPTRDSSLPKPSKSHLIPKGYCDCSYSIINSSFDQDIKQLSQRECAAQTTCPIYLNDFFIKIAKTPSGASVLGFDKDFVKVIENKTKMDPPSSTKLIITDSGQILIEFKSEFHNTNIDRMMKLKKILPGCLFFKGNKNVSALIQRSVDNMPEYISNLQEKVGKVKPNAVLRRTPSGIVLIIATEPMDQLHNRLLALVPETYTKLKVLDNNDTAYEFPGVLKSTPSRNYVLAIDKEFEKCVKATVKNIIKDDSKAILTLGKSDSGSHLVKFGCCNPEPQTEIGIIKKTRSGNLKFVSNILDNVNLGKKDISESEKAMELSKFCKELILHLPKTKSYQLTMHQTDQLYDLNENRFSSTKKLKKLTKQNQVKKNLGKTPLSKDLKANFIKNIKKYLDSSESLPIRTTVSDSMILFVRRRCSKAPILLKFTRSSNIYVTKLKKRQNKDVAAVSSQFHMLQNRRMENKLLGTKTIVEHENDSCDLSDFDSNMTILYHEVSKLVESETDGTMKPSSNQLSLTIRAKRNSLKSDKTKPHIVIKPTSGMSCVYHNSDFNELSELGSRTTFHVENKIITNDEVSSSRYKEDKKRCWDSLRFLPPQLPSFLGEVGHMYN